MKKQLFVILVLLGLQSCVFTDPAETLFGSDKDTDKGDKVKCLGVWEVTSYREYPFEELAYPQISPRQTIYGAYNYTLRYFIKITDSKIYFIKKITGDLTDAEMSDLDLEFGTADGVAVTSVDIDHERPDEMFRVTGKDCGYFWFVDKDEIVLKKTDSYDSTYSDLGENSFDEFITAAKSDENLDSEIKNAKSAADPYTSVIMDMPENTVQISLFNLREYAPQDTVTLRYRVLVSAGKTYYFGYDGCDHVDTRYEGDYDTINDAFLELSISGERDGGGALATVLRTTLMKYYHVYQFTAAKTGPVYVTIKVNVEVLDISYDGIDMLTMCGSDLPEPEGIYSMIVNTPLEVTAQAPLSQGHEGKLSTFRKVELIGGKTYWLYDETPAESGVANGFFGKIYSKDTFAGVEIHKVSFDFSAPTNRYPPKYIIPPVTGIYYIEAADPIGYTVRGVIQDTEKNITQPYTLGTALPVPEVKRYILRFTPSKTKLTAKLNDETRIGGDLYRASDLTKIEHMNYSSPYAFKVSVVPGTEYIFYFESFMGIKTQPTSTLTLTESD